MPPWKPDELHVNTPQMDGGAKKLKKYSWMTAEKVPSDAELSYRSLDAIFIAPTISQCVPWVKFLNYELKKVLLLSADNCYSRLYSIEPDDDVPVYLCGTWVSEFMNEDEYAALGDVIAYLISHGFDYMEVPEIGKANP